MRLAVSNLSLPIKSFLIAGGHRPWECRPALHDCSKEEVEGGEKNLATNNLTIRVCACQTRV